MALNNTDKRVKAPPHSKLSEQSVLGCMIVDENALVAGISVLKEEMFFYGSHRLVFGAVSSLYEEGKSIDLVSVTDRLMFRKQIDDAGGAAYIADLTDQGVMSYNFDNYAHTMIEVYKLREMIRVADLIKKNCFDYEGSADQIIDENERLLFDVTQAGVQKNFESVKSMLPGTVAHLEALKEHKGGLTGVDTGFDGLNGMTDGFHGGDFVVVAGRPGMGKTAFALNMAENVAEKGKAVAIFSLEMASRQLVMRLLGSHARIDSNRLRKGNLRSPDWTALIQAFAFYKGCDIFIDSTPTLTPLEMRARCRRLKSEQENLGMVVVDYIQLMDMSRVERRDNRQGEIANISRSLKQMALELDLPVVGLSQLNREGEKNTKEGIPGRPQLSQLRESGAIEQDADVVLMLYRPGYYTDDENKKDRAECIVAKQRNGPTGIVPLVFHDAYARFDNAPGEWDGE